MNVIEELRKRHKRPYNLSVEEFEAFYANLYNVLALEGHVANMDSLYFAARDIIEMFLLRQAGYGE